MSTPFGGESPLLPRAWEAFHPVPLLQAPAVPVDSLGLLEAVGHSQDEEKEEASSNQRRYKDDLKDICGKRRSQG